MNDALPSSSRLPLGHKAGDVLGGKYRVAEEVGAGGMGRVVAAEHLLLKRRVAIKLLPERSGSSRRLMREARASQSLRSENVIFVYDVALEGDVPYIVMELLEGRNLSQVVAEEGPLPIGEAVDYVLQACAGLAEAHAAGIVHRDIKPSNLFLTRRASGEPLVKVLDFGISKTSFTDELEQTQANSVLGSPYYMSPEQLRDPDNVDARTDVWSLAVTLYALLTGRRPFEGRSLTEVSAAIAADAHVSLKSKGWDVPDGLDALIARALEKRPEARTGSILQFASELREFASERGQKWAERLREDYAQSSDNPQVSAVRTRQAPFVELSELTATDHRLAGTRDLETSRSDSVSVPKRSLWISALTACALVLLVSLLMFAKSRRDVTQVAEPQPAQVRENVARSAVATSPVPTTATPAQVHEVPQPPSPEVAASKATVQGPAPARSSTSSRKLGQAVRSAASAVSSAPVKAREPEPEPAKPANVPEPAAKRAAPVDIDGIPIVE